MEPTRTPACFKTIVPGGLVVGILDLQFAIHVLRLILVQNRCESSRPCRGTARRPAAYEGGLKTFLLGNLITSVLPSCIAAVYYAACLIFSGIARHALLVD